jgi:hypothetical protein
VRTLAEWLAARVPEPPARLAAALQAVSREGSTASVGRRDAEEIPAVEALATVARERLEQALAHPGRDRESAFRLLEADALFTYACEAALEAEDPEAALHRILGVAGR